jgi:hypothetical protein
MTEKRYRLIGSTASPYAVKLGGMVEALLRISGELYLPFLKYQVKCLTLLRDKFAALDADSRAALRPVLERTGCWPHLASG